MSRIAGLTAIPLILALMLAAFAACGSDEPTAHPTIDRTTETTTTGNTPAPDAQREQTAAKDDSSAPEPTGTPQPPAQSTASTSEEPATTSRSTKSPPEGEETAQPPVTPDSTETAAAVPPTPEPETGGICARTPAVQEAILSALGMEACSQVEDSHLATVTTLKVTAEKVSPEDVAGLTAITDLDLELNGGINAHLAALTTLRRAEITINLPVVRPEQLHTEGDPPWAVPDDFLPRSQKSTDTSFAGFEYLRYNISPGYYPVDRTHANLGQALLTRYIAARTLHLRDESETSWKLLTYATERYLAPETTENLVVELRIPTRIPGQQYDTRITLGNYLGSHLKPGPKVQSFTLVSLNPEVEINLYNDTFSWSDAMRHLKYVEIRGRLEIEPYALSDLREVEELHLDPDSSGNPHRLHVGRTHVDGEPTLPPVTGTGFVLAN